MYQLTLMPTRTQTKTYSGTVKIELGKEIFRYKKLDIGAYIAAGYTLTDSRTMKSIW